MRLHISAIYHSQVEWARMVFVIYTLFAHSKPARKLSRPKGMEPLGWNFSPLQIERLRFNLASDNLLLIFIERSIKLVPHFSYYHSQIECAKMECVIDTPTYSIDGIHTKEEARIKREKDGRVGRSDDIEIRRRIETLN
ncbi:hypothetical protein ACJX0J_006562 [Zea mays]